MEQENLNNNGAQPPEPELETPTAPETQPVPADVPQPGKSEKPEKQKKELTPAEMQRRKKMLVMPLIFIVFGAAMWLIFAPADDADKQVVGLSGLNVELPTPKDEGIISDKKDAYEQEALKNKQQERMRSLQDFSSQLADAEQQSEEERQLRTASKSVELSDNLSRLDGGGSSSRRTSSNTAIQSSAAAYQDINKQLGTWYEQPATEADKQSQAAVESRLQELERKLDEEAQRKKIEDDQLAMVEKTYQMAAKYMPQTAQGVPGSTTGEMSTGSSAQGGQSGGKVIAQPVKQVRPNVVSLLASPPSDEEFIAAYSKPRNLGFLTAAGNEGVQDKNSISACVYQTITLTNGKEIQIRLLEPMWAGTIQIPANTVVTGTCRITGERLDVIINSIQYADNIIPVELLVYDTDGQRGIFVPGNDEINAAKEVASTLANSSGSSIMISDNAGSQLAADMGKGLIQGASQYLSKKMSVVKVTIKANYRLLLLPKTQ